MGRAPRALCLLAGLGVAALGCGGGSDEAGEPEVTPRYSVRLDTARPERLVAEVEPREPWTLDMEFASVVVLGEAGPQAADRIAERRIVFDVPRAPGAESPRTGTLHFAVCGEGGCEPVEHAFRLP